jgi:hypothetical protein
MKHWNTLTELENEVHRIREFKTLFDVVTRGIAETGSNMDEVVTVLYTLLGMVEDIDEKLYPKFHELWDEIRTDSFESDQENAQKERESRERWTAIVGELQKNHVSEG